MVRGDFKRQEARDIAENCATKKDETTLPNSFDPFTSLKTDSDMLSSVKDIKSNLSRQLNDTSRRLTTGIFSTASKDVLVSKIIEKRNRRNKDRCVKGCYTEGYSQLDQEYTKNNSRVI